MARPEQSLLRKDAGLLRYSGSSRAGSLDELVFREGTAHQPSSTTSFLGPGFGASDDGRVAGHPRWMKMGSAAVLRSAKLGTGESEDGVAPGALRDSELCREHVDQTLD
jgi:hypothetical protein